MTNKCTSYPPNPQNPPGAGNPGCDCSGNEDCAGICNGPHIIDCTLKCVHSSLAQVYDCDGVCGGTNFNCGCDTHCDCNGDCGGTAIVDCEGVCGGQSKADCAGICNGNTTLDCDGACGGTNFNCGCVAGYDCDGICGGTNFSCNCNGILDCNGDCNGDAVVDCNGVCGGANFSCEINGSNGCTKGYDCDGACGGTNFSCMPPPNNPCTQGYDCAGTCGGSDFSCGCNGTLDCSGDCDGSAVADCEGVCGGTNFSCSCNGSFDCDGDCNGNAKKDCNGNCNGSDVYDCDGVCGGTNFSCNCNGTLDCNGDCDGGAVVDCEGVCGGSNFNCGCIHGYDCDGICGGNNYTDCGKCHFHFFDCHGECGGYAIIDCNGECGGNASFDCSRACGGTNKIDCKGTCGGDDTSCGCQEGFDCLGICGGSAGYDSYGVCAGNNKNPFKNPVNPDYPQPKDPVKNPKSKQAVQTDTRIPDCGFPVDSYENCNGDVFECGAIQYDQYKNSCVLISDNFCGYNSNGEPAYTDACGECFGSETDVTKCGSTQNKTYNQSSFSESELCSGACGYIFSNNVESNITCLNKDICEQCGGSISDPNLCSNPENRPYNSKEDIYHCDFWLATWSNGTNEYSAWVKDPYVSDFLYSQDNLDYLCYRPVSIAGPMCPPDEFLYYGGGYTPCGNYQTIELDLDSKDIYEDNPFTCEAQDSCGVFPWGGCKFLDVCGVCGGWETNDINCPDYEEEVGDDNDNSCYIVLGYWINDRTGDMFSAWIDINSSDKLEQDFSATLDSVTDCYKFLYTDASYSYSTCSPPSGDPSPVYNTKKPTCESPLEVDPNYPEDLSYIDKDKFSDYDDILFENPFLSKTLCLSSPTTAVIQGGEYKLSNLFDSNVHEHYGLGVGTYLLNIPQSNPIILEDSNAEYIYMYGSQTQSGVYGTGYFGVVFIKVINNFNVASFKCVHNGYEFGGKNKLFFSSKCSESCSFKTIENCGIDFNSKSINFDKYCNKIELPSNDTDYKNKACIDPYACNWDPYASYGSIFVCDYSSCSGCKDQRACNNNPNLKYSNCSNCNYDCLDDLSCRNSEACNYNPMGKEHDESLCDYSCYTLVKSISLSKVYAGTNFITIPQNDLKYFCINDLISIGFSDGGETKRVTDIDNKNIYLEDNFKKSYEDFSEISILKTSHTFTLDSLSINDNEIKLSCGHSLSIGDKIIINEGKQNQEILEITFIKSDMGEYNITNPTKTHEVGSIIKLLNILNCYV